MTLGFTDFHPKCSVEVWTWRGDYYDITGDLMSWQTQKSIEQPQGSFVVSLTAATHNGKDWSEIIMPMDYVQIRASATGQKSQNGSYPIIMRGFVDYSGKSFGLGATGGPSEPRVVIQGRDYAKLLLEWQVLYLWTQNNAPQMSTAHYGLLFNYGLPINPESLTSFFNDVFAKLVNPIVAGLKQSWLSDIPHFETQVDLPDYETSSTIVQAYSGSYWNLFDYFSSPPFSELFVWDDVNYPVLTARVTPYRTWMGVTPSPGKELKPSIVIPAAEIQGYNFGISDNDVYTYFLTWGDATQQTNQITMPAYITDTNGVNTENQSLYGTRPLIIDSSWINPNLDTKVLSDASDMNTWLMEVMQDNMYFQSGTIQVQGRARYIIGQYATVDAWDKEYYISGVSHQFTAFDRWDTQLTVSRGRPLNPTQPPIETPAQINSAANQAAIANSKASGSNTPPLGMIRAMQPNG